MRIKRGGGGYLGLLRKQEPRKEVARSIKMIPVYVRRLGKRVFDRWVSA